MHLNSRSRIPHCAFSYIVTLSLVSHALCMQAVHHMKSNPPRVLVRRDGGISLKITNLCAETIHPGVTTQSGIGPDSTGFELESQSSQTKSVSWDWQGRIWGRTNCSFDSSGFGSSRGGGGYACGTGDCNGLLQCMVTVRLPCVLENKIMKPFHFCEY